MNKEKHSAYRSMRLASEGKTKPTNKNNKGALERWVRERWVNLTGLLTDNKELPCGTKGKKQKEKGLPSVCRPSIKINEKTPKPLSSELDKTQIQKAIKIKQQNKRIDWSKL